MALTATLAVLPQGEQPGRQCVATLTVTNGGGSAVGVVSVRPYIASFGSAQDQNVPANIGMVTPPPPNNLGAGDVLQFSFPFVVLASAQVELAIGAEIQGSDGSIIRATQAPFMVLNTNVVPLVGKLQFNLFENSGLTAAL